MGRPERIDEVSPCAMRKISGCISSYDTIGIIFLKASKFGAVHAGKPCRCKYSAGAFCVKISLSTRCCTTSAFSVTSSMNRRALRCSSGMSIFGASGMVFGVVYQCSMVEELSFDWKQVRREMVVMDFVQRGGKQDGSFCISNEEG